MTIKEKENLLKEIDGIPVPNGCDWQFLCGYMLAIRRIKEKVAAKRAKKRKAR